MNASSDGSLVEAIGGPPGRQHQAALAGSVNGRLDLDWMRIATSGTDPLPSELLGKIVDGINSALNADRFDVVDSAFRAADVKQMSMEAMVVYSRAPFMARFKLKCWRLFLDGAATEISRRGYDAAKILRGLI